MHELTTKCLAWHKDTEPVDLLDNIIKLWLKDRVEKFAEGYRESLTDAGIPLSAVLHRKAYLSNILGLPEGDVIKCWLDVEQKDMSNINNALERGANMGGFKTSTQSSSSSVTWCKHMDFSKDCVPVGETSHVAVKISHEWAFCPICGAPRRTLQDILAQRLKECYENQTKFVGGKVWHCVADTAISVIENDRRNKTA